MSGITSSSERPSEPERTPNLAILATPLAVLELVITAIQPGSSLGIADNLARTSDRSYGVSALAHATALVLDVLVTNLHLPWSLLGKRRERVGGCNLGRPSNNIISRPDRDAGE